MTNIGKIVDYYTYRVIWSEEDKEHVGLCSEFPSLSHLAKDKYDAYRGIINLVTDVAKDMVKNRETIPEPISVRKFSGKFQLRLTPEKHRELVLRATDEGVSLNRYIVQLLNYA